MRLAGAALLLAATTGIGVPAAWLHNPRERTTTALRAWRRGDFAAASRDLEKALDSGETPRTLYNAGTGRLGNGVPGAALPLLTKAAAAKGPERADALYNLGNAYMKVGDMTTAVDAFVASLRERPDFLPAKHNLELALRQQQQQQQQQKPQQPQGGQGKGQGGGGNGGGQQPPQQQPPQKNGSGGQGQQQQQPPQSGQQGSSQLPNFTAQKDMSPQQAAALLEAVENLEREQRRQQAQAEREARAKQPTEKDW